MFFFEFHLDLDGFVSLAQSLLSLFTIVSQVIEAVMFRLVRNSFLLNNISMDYNF